jgi:hypothetical protein
VIVRVEIIVEPVVVPVPLRTIPVEIADIEVAVGITNVWSAAYFTAHRILSGLYLIRHIKCLRVPDQVSLFFKYFRITLSKTLAVDILEHENISFGGGKP